MILVGVVPLVFLPNAPETDKGEYQQIGKTQSYEPGVTALISFWAYLALITVYMMSIMPHFVRIATNSTNEEEMRHVTLILSAATLGRVLGGMIAGYCNKWVGESVVVGMSSFVVVLGLGCTLYLTTVPYNLFWIPVGL